MKIRGIFNKLVLKFHRYAGLLIAFHLLILAITGVILITKAELQRQKSVDVASANSIPVNQRYEHAYQYLLKQYPNERLLDMYVDDNNASIIHARLSKTGSNKVSGAHVVNFDDSIKQEQIEINGNQSAFIDWIIELHQQLFMGKRGQLYVGVIGIGFILMNLTGLMMYLKSRRLRKRIKMYPDKSLRMKLNLLHQTAGILCIVWGLVVGVSGTLLAFNPLITQRFQQESLKPLAARYSQITTNKSDQQSLQAILNSIMQKNPSADTWYIVFPGMERGIDNHYLILARGSGVFSRYLSDYFVVNAETAELKEVIRLPFLMQMVMIATPFHLVSYGGILTRIVWVMFAIYTMFLAILGVSMFYQRKRKIYAKSI